MKLDVEPDTPQELSPAKRKLVLAAETLFARNGLDGASLREIASTAGHKNHNAVQYHFGSREGLVQAVFSFRMMQMDATRTQMFHEAEKEGRLDDLRTIVEIIFVPQIDLIGVHGDHAYSAFLSEYLMRFSGSSFGDFGEGLPHSLRLTLVQLRKLMPEMSDVAAQRRLITACFMFLNVLAIYTRQLKGAKTETLALAVSDTIDQIIAALKAPINSPVTELEPVRVA